MSGSTADKVELFVSEVELMWPIDIYLRVLLEKYQPLVNHRLTSPCPECCELKFDQGQRPQDNNQ